MDGRRSPAVDLLREYVTRARLLAGGNPLEVSRQALLDSADIRDRNVRQASHTLQKVLDRLVQEEQIGAYDPRPLSHGATDVVTITWPARNAPLPVQVSPA